MNKKERIEAFGDLILHTNKVPLWIYDSNYQLEYTSYPDDDYMGFDALFQSQVAEILSSEDTVYTTSYAYSFLNLLWILDFELKNDKLNKIYALGPTFTNENSFNELKSRMDERGLSVQIKAIVSRQLNRMSIIPHTVVSNYAQQLHYLLHGDLIPVNDIQIINNNTASSDSNDIKSSSHYGIWASEDRKSVV